MTQILALDVSGSATGWALGENHTLIDYGKYISNLNKPRGERLFDFYTWIHNLIETRIPNIILIEKPYRGRNSNVLVSLSKHISIIEVVAYDILGLYIRDDWFIDSKLVKKTLGLKKKKGSVEQKYRANKAAVVRKINSIYGLNMKYVGGNNKNKNDDDICDAIAVFYTWTVLDRVD